MNNPNPVALGAMLILIGLALAFLAAYVVLNRRREGSGEDTGKADQAEADGEASGNPIPAELANESHNTKSPAGPSQEAAEPSPEAGTAAADEGQEETDRAEQEPPAPEPAPETSDPELIPLMQLYREEVSGVLVLRTKDGEYRTGEEIRDERDRRRIEFALADLSGWFASAAEGSNGEKRRSAAEKTSGVRDGADAQGREAGAADGRERAGDEKNAGSKAEPAGGMIEGINAILKEALARDDSAPRGVSLVSDASGVVRVLIGLKSYPMDEVPDETVRSLIRQAVQEWEASQ